MPAELSTHGFSHLRRVAAMRSFALGCGALPTLRRFAGARGLHCRSLPACSITARSGRFNCRFERR